MLCSCSGTVQNPLTTEQWKPASRSQTDTQSAPSHSCLLFLFAAEEVRPGNGFCWRVRCGTHATEAPVPRKEVIQPHLPVRLPCYDFTPITNPTLDACLPVGLAQRLQVLPTFVV